MWAHILLIIFTINGLYCMQVVVDINQVILETAGAVVDFTDESNLKSATSSFTGANVGALGGSSSHNTESGHSHHGTNRGHRRNATSNPARMTKTGDIRCFCNMPQCVATSYMCKAEVGGCFSDLSVAVDSSRTGMHGCVELLPEARRNDCPSSITSPGSARSSLLLCCQKDLCNHIDSPEIRLLLNATYHGANGASSPSNGRVYFGSDVWLKAATIAVPICGGFILVLLIILAVKILRKDSKRQSGPIMRGAYVQCQSGPMRGQPSKMQLLLEESSPQPYDKNMAHARLNFNNCPGKQNVFPTVHGGIVPADQEQPLCKNIIKWGNNNQDSASPV